MASISKEKGVVGFARIWRQKGKGKHVGGCIREKGRR